MSTSKTPKNKRTPVAAPAENLRTYESDTLAIKSLRLIAAPDPKDDLSEDELRKMGQRGFSAEFIQHLIDCIKSI